MLNNVAKYLKAIIAFAGMAATFLTSNGFPTEGKWLSGVVAAVTAILVLLIPNVNSVKKTAE